MSTPLLTGASPEATGRYECPACGNTSSFVGSDDRGFAGPDECDGSCGHNEDDPNSYCKCETALTQAFTVHSQDGTRGGANIEYLAWTGGGADGEIGSYSRIYCGRCDTLLWRDPTLTTVEE
jgi:hypothetical protein